MAGFETVDVSGTKISVKAKGATAGAEVEIHCTTGTVEIDLGTRDVEEKVCIQGGSGKSTKALKFGEGNLNGEFDGSLTDAAQVLLLQALYHEGDFMTDNTLEISIEFPNSDGKTGAVGLKIDYEALVTGAKLILDPEGKLAMDLTYSQLNKPTITKAVPGTP